MIYITKRNFGGIEFVNKVWESPFEDLRERYKAELVNIAKNDGLVVNPNNPEIVISYRDNSKISKIKFKKVIDWIDFTNKYTFDFFLMQNKDKYFIKQHNFIEI